MVSVVAKLLACVALLVLMTSSVPAVSASTAPTLVDGSGWEGSCPLPPSPESDGTGFEWLSVHVPERLAVHHPLLVGVTAESDNTQMRSHIDMTVRVLYQNETVFETASVHEHDGLHTFVFTPDRVGVWSVQVSEPRRDRIETYTHHVQVCAPDLSEWDSLEAWDGVEGELSVHDHGLHLLLDGATHDLPMLGLFDVRDSAGRLAYSGWNGHFHAMHAKYDTSRPGAAELFVLPDMTAKEAVWTQRKAADWDGDHAGTGAFWDPLLATRDCTSRDLVLLTDPSTIQQGTLTWQADSDLRFSLVDPLHAPLSGAKSYHIERLHPIPAALSNAPFQSQRVVDPFGTITLRLPDPGHYLLRAQDLTTGDETCTEFLIVPNTATGRVGTATAHIHTNTTDAEITLSAGDQNIRYPHYEFDTRVYQQGSDDTPGRLVWMGKLHAHHDSVSLRLADLPAGDYEVITYPSPQDQGIPPVATDDPDGFRWPFTITGSRGVNMTEEAVPFEQGLIPALAPLLPALLALAVLGAHRRDR